MAEGSVGTVSLDLVIQNNTAEQIEKIQNQVKQPAQKIGESIESSIEVPIQKTAENVQKTLGSAFEKASETAQKNAEKIESAINRPLESMAESLSNRVNYAVKNIQKSLENAEISSDPTERLVDGLENIAAKMGMINDQRVEILNSSEFTENDLKKLNQMESQLISLGNTADKYKQKIDSVGSETTSAVNTQFQEIFDRLKSFRIPTTPVENLRAELENTREKIALLQKQWQELSTAEPSERVVSQMLRVQQQIVSAQSSAERLESRLAELNQTNLSHLQQECNKLVSLIIAPLKGLGNTALAPVRAVASGIMNIGKACNSAYEKIKYYLENPLYAVRDAGKAVFSGIKKAGSNAFSAIKKVGSSAFGVMKSVGGKALDSLKSRFGFLNKSAVSLTKPVKKLGTTLKNTFRRVFVMATLYAAVKAIKNSFSEILKSNDELSNSLNEVKANLSIAFTPIIQAVMPALNTMMSGLARATKYVAGFISGLFGMTYKQAAEATKKLHDTGKQAADTAKKASMSMAGIDEMNILSDNSDESADDEEKSGIDYSKIDMSEPEFPDWAKRLKEAIKSGDWYGVGGILAERVNAVFGGIDWENIEKKVADRVNKICNLINGFVDNLNWEYLGNALAGGINTVTSVINAFSDNIHWEKIGSGLANGLNQAVNKIKWKQLGRSLSAGIRILTNLLYGFVTEFNWKELGNGIGEAVNGWFDGIDFDKLGTALSEGIKGIFSTVTAMLQTVDFGSIGGKIAGFVNNIDVAGILTEFAYSASELLTGLLELLIEFVEQTDWLSLGEQIKDSVGEIIQNIDWNGIIEKASELLGGVIGGIVALIAPLLTEAWNSVKEYFNKKIEECGGNIWKGVAKGIVDALKNVGNWIKEHIFKPFMNGFKKIFGIHSPSREMAAMGDFIIAGLFNAISDGIKKIKEIFTKLLNVIKGVFEKVDLWFKDKFETAWQLICSVWDGVKGYFSDIWTGIENVFSVVSSWFGERFTDAWDNIKNAFLEVKGFFEGVWNSITNVFSHVTNWFRDTFSDAWEAVRNVFSKGGEIFTGITDGIFETFKTIVNGLIDGINWVIEQPFNAINWALDGIRDIEIFDWYPFEWLPTIDVPQIPKLAKGGLATAPTLAMVGDNKNARTDPEVIAPLSKLEGMLGDNSEITELLKIIVELLKSGMNIEIINYMFRNSHEFNRQVIKAIAEDNARKGEK